jgi:hypothetical protein
LLSSNCYSAGHRCGSGSCRCQCRECREIEPSNSCSENRGVCSINIEEESNSVEEESCTESANDNLKQVLDEVEMNSSAVVEALLFELPANLDDNEMLVEQAETSIEEFNNQPGSMLSQNEKKALMNKGARYVFVEIGEGYHRHQRFLTDNEVAFYNYDMYECAYDPTAYRLLWDIFAPEGRYLVELMNMVTFNQLKSDKKIWIRRGGGVPLSMSSVPKSSTSNYISSQTEPVGNNQLLTEENDEEGVEELVYSTFIES